MKLLKSVLLSLPFLFILNCSNNNETDENSPIEFTGAFLPLSINNEWEYNIVDVNNEYDSTTNTEDMLSVESSSTSGFKLTANDGEGGNGVMTNILTSGDLTLTTTTLSLNGILNSPVEAIDFEIIVDNMLLYNTKAAKDAEIYNKMDVINQTIQGYPITTNYTLTTTQLDNINNMTVDDVDYKVVTSAKIVLELYITTQVTFFNFIQTIPLLDKQEVLIITAYYAKDVGLIKAVANIDYELNSETISILEQGGFDLATFDTSSSRTNTQELSSYTIQD